MGADATPMRVLQSDGWRSTLVAREVSSERTEQMPGSCSEPPMRELEESVS